MITKGQRYYSTTYQNNIEVTRVAANQAWADILVKPPNGAKPWRKRQVLVDGRFPFPVMERSTS
jgi:hypothetical protein